MTHKDGTCAICGTEIHPREFSEYTDDGHVHLDCLLEGNTYYLVFANGIHHVFTTSEKSDADRRAEGQVRAKIETVKAATLEEADAKGAQIERELFDEAYAEWEDDQKHEAKEHSNG